MWFTTSDVMFLSLDHRILFVSQSSGFLTMLSRLGYALLLRILALLHSIPLLFIIQAATKPPPPLKAVSTVNTHPLPTASPSGYLIKNIKNSYRFR